MDFYIFFVLFLGILRNTEVYSCKVLRSETR